MKNVFLILMLFVSVSAKADFFEQCNLLSKAALNEKLVAGVELQAVDIANKNYENDPSHENFLARYEANRGLQDADLAFYNLCIEQKMNCRSIADIGLEKNLVASVEHRDYLKAKKDYEGTPHGQDIILIYFQQEQHIRQNFEALCRKF